MFSMYIYIYTYGCTHMYICTYVLCMMTYLDSICYDIIHTIFYGIMSDDAML